MINGKTIVLVIPAYNEACGLFELLYQMPKFIDEVVVVDNNSTDSTARVADYFGCTVLHERKQGNGAAFKRGFCHALKHDIIVSMDGDNSYPLDEAERCVRYLLDNNLDFLSCSRFPLKDKNSMRSLNQVGNRFLAMVANELFDLELHDITTTMWVLRPECATFSYWCSDGFPFCVDFKLANALSRFVRFGETHIGYRPRIGKVKQHRWRDGFKYLWTMLAMRIRT